MSDKKCICIYCGLELSSPQSLSRHKNKYCKKTPKKTKVAFKRKNISGKLLSRPIPAFIPEPEPRSKPPQPPQPPQPYQQYATIDPMDTNTENKTVIQNININNFYTVQMIGNDLYGELIHKLGYQEAIKLLTSSAANGNPEKIIQRLYLDDIIPEHYPIAYSSEEGQFRYLSDQGQIIKDQHHTITDILSTRIQKAMIYATNDLIRQSISTGNIDELYDVYDISSIQRNLAAMDEQQTHNGFTQKLMKLTSNPNHFMFQNPNPTIPDLVLGGD